MLRSHLHSNSPKNRNIDDEYKQWQSKLAVAEAAGAGDLAEYKRLRPAAVPDHDAANPIISRTRPPWSRSTPRGQWTQLVSADPARPEVRRYEEFEKKISLKIEKAFKGGRTPLNMSGNKSVCFRNMTIHRSEQQPKDGTPIFRTPAQPFEEKHNLCMSLRKRVHAAVACGATPLWLACDGGYSEMAKWIVKNHGDDIEYSLSQPTFEFPGTCFQAACFKGHIDLCRWLADMGVNIEREDRNGHTGFVHACRGGQLHVAGWLSGQAKKAGEKCLDVLQPLKTTGQRESSVALLLAAYMGHLDVCQWLIETKAADPSFVNQYGDTPLIAACLKGQLPVAQYLVNGLRNGACIDFSATADRQSNSCEGISALFAACSEGHLDVAIWLVEEEGAWVEFTDQHGRTPFFCACSRGHLEVAKWLACNHCGWLVDECDHAGTSPFAAALRNGHSDIAKWLATEWPIDVEKADKFGKTPFYTAVDGGVLEASRVKPLILSSRR